MSEERLTEIETKLAFVEASTQELSDLVYAQQRQIDRLSSRCGRLLERIDELATAPGGVDPVDEVPPHY